MSKDTVWVNFYANGETVVHLWENDARSNADNSVIKTEQMAVVPINSEPEKMLTPQEVEFVDYIENTLIPDLQRDGTEETAKDFISLLAIIKRLA